MKNLVIDNLQKEELLLPKYINTQIPPKDNLGIYIHFPFCIKECFYCDFYKVTKFDRVFYDKILSAIPNFCKYLKNLGYNFQKVSTIYFGGGTPSLISPKMIQKILDTLQNNFNFNNQLELTFEINPDINPAYLKFLRYLGINRISIGVQTFNLFGLRITGRTHNVRQIFETIKNVEKFFDNYSIDLIALYPYQTIEFITQDLEIITKINPPHISYYLMDIDKKVTYPSILLSKIKKNYELADNYYEKIIEFLSKSYVHYEISNFAKNNYYCKHNLKYWYYYDYIGFGPSAVSKITINEMVYRIKINEDVKDFSNFFTEVVDPKNQVRERIMLALRTRWGIIIKTKNYRKHLKVRNFKNYNSYLSNIF